MAYRDSLESLRANIAQKRAAVEAEARALSPLQRALLPQSTRRLLVELHLHTKTDPESLTTLEALSTLDSELETLLAAYHSARSTSREQQARPQELGKPPCFSPLPFAYEEPEPKALRTVLSRRVQELRLGSTAERCGDRDVFAELNHGTFRSHFVARLPVPGVASVYQCSLRVMIPADVEALTVLPENGLTHLGQFLGLVRDHTVGDESFDFAFRLSGSPASVALLTTAVRRALLRLHAATASTSLRLGFAEATLGWAHSPDECAGEALDLVLPNAAIDVIVSLHAAIASA